MSILYKLGPEVQELLHEQVMPLSHVPFSKLPRAALLLLSDGTWVPGVRVESATFSLVIPAMLNAVTTALSLHRLDWVAVVSSAPVSLAEEAYLTELPLASFTKVHPHILINGRTSSVPTLSHRLPPTLSASITSPKDGIKKARHVAQHAYIPESHFPVGCVVQTHDGHLLPGVNVEHPNWSHILCAERNVLGTAVSYGLLPIKTIYLSCPEAPLGTPCGACRQLLVELAPTATLWMDRATNPPEQTSPDLLLPGAFRGSMLGS